MVIIQIMMERANGWVWHDKPGGGGSQQSQHNQHLPQSRFDTQASLLRQLAHGQQNRKQTLSFARRISTASARTTLVLLEPTFVP